MPQLTHQAHSPSQSDTQLVVCCDQVKGPANLGAIFRLADAFGVDELVLFKAELSLQSSRFKRTARHTQTRVRFRESENLTQTIAQYHQDGYTSIALEITDQSQPLDQDYQHGLDKILLIIGDENHGISEAVLAIASRHVHIPMRGQNSSMNVAQALGIALYQYTRS